MTDIQTQVSYTDVREASKLLAAAYYTVKDDGYLYTNSKENVSINVALIYAAKNNNNALAKECIEKGGDINVKIFACNSLVKYVIDRNNTRLLEFLISKGVNLKVRTNYRETLLHTAAQCAGEKIVKMLIDNGVKLNLKDSKGHTALMYACERGNLAIVKLLLERGADVSIKPKWHNSILDLVGLVDDERTNYGGMFEYAPRDMTNLINILKQHGAK